MDHGGRSRGLSGADAAGRLRYAGDVRARARRAALVPSFALLALGAVVMVHGFLATAWPHTRAVAIAWVAAAIAARPALRWLRMRISERRGVHGSMRLRAACAAAAVAAAALAFGLGADPLLSSIAMATALAAFLAGFPSVALAAVVVGAVSDALVARGVAASVAQLVFGAGLVAVGLVCRSRERQGA